MQALAERMTALMYADYDALGVLRPTHDPRATHYVPQMLDIVRKLEGGEVPLDSSIALYERGEKLRQHCQARLDAAQLKIEQIIAGADGQAAATRPFDPESGR